MSESAGRGYQGPREDLPSWRRRRWWVRGLIWLAMIILVLAVAVIVAAYGYNATIH